MKNARTIVGTGIVAAALATAGVLMTPGTARAATEYSNCAALNADYPHGVGRTGAVDQTSKTPVTNFTVDDALYSANSGSDRDGDGIACEKK